VNCHCDSRPVTCRI